MDYVKINKKRVFITNGNLFLDNYNINEIRDIKKLKSYPNLKGLFLENNKLTKIEGLDHLVNLNKLHLEGNSIN